MKHILPFLILSLANLQINCDNASIVAEYAKSKVGCGYIFGVSGEICTHDLMIKLSGPRRRFDYKNYRRWAGKEVFDKTGFVNQAFPQVGIKLDKKAIIIFGVPKWEATGEIANYPKNKVCILYKKNEKGKFVHKGIYIGNGEYIYAKGSLEGVVKEEMTGEWTHWAIQEGLYNKE